MFCREQAVQLHRERDAIRKKDASLVFIGNGNRNFANGFKDAYGIEAPLYVDTRRDAYRALGMKRGISRVLNAAMARRMWRALRTGARQGIVQGDAWQMGGVLVVRPGGRVAYSYLSETPGDHPPVADVLGALG
jgi:hypothetical protein